MNAADTRIVKDTIQVPAFTKTEENLFIFDAWMRGKVSKVKVIMAIYFFIWTQQIHE